MRTEHPIEFALPDDLPLVRADAAQLERVFSNLIENAIKHSPAGGAVRVSGMAYGGRVTIRVVDSGPGIPAAQRSRVFEPFFRGSGGGGSGLGLAICRGFVQANGGQIAAGERPWRRRVARRQLPGDAPAGARAGPVSGLTGARRRRRTADRTGLTVILRAAGYEVRVRGLPGRGARRARRASAGRDAARSGAARR